MVGHCCLLAHLKEVESFGLYVAERVLEARHWADCAFNCHIHVFSVGFRCLKARATLERVQAFVFDQVGTHETLAQL